MQQFVRPVTRQAETQPSTGEHCGVEIGTTAVVMAKEEYPARARRQAEPMMAAVLELAMKQWKLSSIPAKARAPVALDG
ncbi:hypothetical protein [Caballeronia humi]|jgi:hypothetical protein|nr:hypothetical protein [Caballeronia humi]